MMETIGNGSATVHAIQLSIAPVFLLAGIGAFLNVIAGRLSRVVDRARLLETLHPEVGDIERRRYVVELHLLEQRMTLASRAIYLGTASGLAVCLLVIALFVGELISLKMGNAIAVLFVIAIALLAGSMVTFLRETRIALKSLHVREDLLKADPYGVVDETP
jgi:MFS family permease